MANYELMFIVDPSLSEEERNSSISNFKSILEKNSSKIEKEEIMWEKKLAYKINKSSLWFYVLLELELDWTKIKDISTEVNLDKNIWRYMFTRIED